MRLYLDNCALNRPYDDQSGARVRLEAESVQLILEALECGRLDMVWSFVLDIENDQNPFEERRTGVARWKPFAVEIVNDVNEVQSRAEHLVTLGFKPVDALHLAGAIIGKAAHFITVDDGILKKKGRVTEVAIMSPREFVERFGEQL